MFKFTYTKENILTDVKRIISIVAKRTYGEDGSKYALMTPSSNEMAVFDTFLTSSVIGVAAELREWFTYDYREEGDNVLKFAMRSDSDANQSLPVGDAIKTAIVSNMVARWLALVGMDSSIYIADYNNSISQVKLMLSHRDKGSIYVNPLKPKNNKIENN